MLAYLNDPKIKEGVLAEMAKHREADNLIQGYGYWKDGKGCAVGCLIKGSDHSEYETKFGIPEMLARLEDTIFEGLPIEDARLWPERFLKAINTGADLSMVFYKFTHWLLIDENDGVIKYAKTEKTKEFIIKVASFYGKYIEKEISLEEFRADASAAAYAYADAAAAYTAAAAAAYTAASYAAADAAASAAADAAASAAAAYAAYAAAYAAYAAYAAAYAYADAARKKSRIKQADKLIELLEQAI